MSILNLEYIRTILSSFETVGLKQIADISMQNRKDCKFFFHIEKLPLLLEKLSSEYFVLEIAGENIFLYQTNYYDTPDLKMYYAHHNQKMNRYKIRFRNYIVNNKTFLEIKFKNNKNITKKARFPLKQGNNLMNKKTLQFIQENSGFDFSQLQKILESSFYRITLVDKAMTMRFTIDIGLSFSNGKTDIIMDKLIIAELKSTQISNTLRFILKDLRIYPQKISKYCLGQALLNKDIKSNRFKERLLLIDKICKSNY